MIGKGEDYTTGSLLDYDYFKKNYKLVVVDLSKQKELDADPRPIQQIGFKYMLETNSTDLPIKTEEEAYEKIIDISRNNEYRTGNLFDYDYFKKYYKLIAIDLSKQQVLQENKDLIQQINFIGRLIEAANIFIIIEKKENTTLEFSQNLANVLYK